MTTALVVDASCDIPNRLLQKYGIGVLPISITTNGHTLLDWRNPDETLAYYRDHLVDKGNTVTTDPVSVQDAMDQLSEGSLQHADYIVVQTTSRTRSKTFDRLTEAADRLNARLGKGAAPKTVRVMDSRSLFAGQGVIAAHTQTLINQGLEASQLRRAAVKVADDTHTFVVPPDLYYIRERARQRGETSITLARAMLGKTLGITPVVAGFREKNFPAAKFKGFASAVEATLNHLLAQIDRDALTSPFLKM